MYLLRLLAPGSRSSDHRRTLLISTPGKPKQFLAHSVLEEVDRGQTSLPFGGREWRTIEGLRGVRIRDTGCHVFPFGWRIVDHMAFPVPTKTIRYSVQPPWGLEKPIHISGSVDDSAGSSRHSAAASTFA